MMTDKLTIALRVLVIDDEKSVRRFLCANLSCHGYQVFEAEDAQEGIRKSISDRPDVIILDLGLPDLDGFEVLKHVRSRSRVPIIILSVREEAADKITALNAGADDYLTKPFSEGELLARIGAVLRRLKPVDEEPILKTGHLTVDLSERRVELTGKPLSLTPTEFELLKILVMDAGKVIMHDRLYKALWDKTPQTEGIAHLLRVTVSNLRNKIEPYPERPSYIVTEPGIGYRFQAQLA